MSEDRNVGSYNFGAFNRNKEEMERLTQQARAGGFVDEQIWTLTDLKDGMEVLDLACGTGDVTLRMAQRIPGGTILGLDATESLLDQARQNLDESAIDNVTFQTGDVYNLDFGGRRFDYVYVRLLFQHMDRPQEAMDSIRRVVKPGGRAVVIDVDDDWLMLEPEPETFSAYNLAASRGQAAGGGDRHVGRRLPGYMHQAGFKEVRMDVVTLSSFDIGLKAFLAITTRFKMEQIPEEDRAKAAGQLETIMKVLDEPYSWGMVAAFIAQGGC